MKSAVSISRTFQADAQLNLKPSYDVGEPIRVGCNCAPAEGVKLTTEWSYSAGLKAIDVDDLTKDVWAKPGPQKITVKLKLLRTHKLTVFVPDPKFPGDVTKAKLEQIEVFDGYTESTLEGEFVQQGTVTPVPVPPGPGPEPPAPPTPPAPVAGPLRVLILEDEESRLQGKYKRDQVEAMFSSAVLDYVNSHCAKGSDGSLQFNRWDDSYSEAGLSKAGWGDWLDIYAEGKAAGSDKKPYLLIQQKDAAGSWKTQYGGQITDVPSTFNTLKKFGGK